MHLLSQYGGILLQEHDWKYGIDLGFCFVVFHGLLLFHSMFDGRLYGQKRDMFELPQGKQETSSNLLI